MDTLDRQGIGRVTLKSGGTSRLHLRTLFSVGGVAALTDGQLLERFATGHGEVAELSFAAIVERHGLMVYRVCSGILKDEHEAHDAFQATFLVLLRKRDTLWARDSLGPWLHRVACRAAVRARVEARRRQSHEIQAAGQTMSRRCFDDAGDLEAIHEEVDRLPERYRVPILLCDLQGRTYAEAAEQLGCPVGTVRSRLARGRERLRDRLTRRGLAPSAALIGAALAPSPASAAMPWASGGAILRCARSILAGGAFTPGEAPASVLAITEGVLKVISIGKLILMTTSVLTAVGLAVGAGVLAQQAADRPPSPAEQPRAPEADRRWVATLPGGSVIEVLGVSTYPSKPDSWWRPDGSPLAEAPCDSPPRSLAMEEGFEILALAARLTWLPADDHQGWTVKEAGGTGESVAKRAGAELPGVRTLLVGLPKGRATCSVEFSSATGPWQTVGVNKGNAGGVASKFGPSYAFGEPVAARKGTVLTVSHDIKDVAVRLVAVDRGGQEREAVRRTGGGVKDFYQMTAEFDLGPGVIREYRLQTRSFERVEIPGIILRPDGRK